MTVEFWQGSLPGWIKNNPEILQLWIEGVSEVGGDTALEWIQASPEYDVIFPGNRREDGSLRHSEDVYFSIIESYERDLRNVGLNPDVFSGRFPELIEGEVSPDEFWQERVLPMYERITSLGPDLMSRYAADYNLDMTPEALLAAALDPDLGSKILERRIALTELKAESDRAFDTDLTNRYAPLIDEMLEFGVTQGTARNLFQDAAGLIPTLTTLASRHADPDDDFDLAEFTQASLFEDPVQKRRMRRLVAQEEATFAGGAAIDFVRDRSGGVAGLQQQ